MCRRAVKHQHNQPTNNFDFNFRENEDDKLLDKNGRGGVMGQKYGETSSTSAQHLKITEGQIRWVFDNNLGIIFFNSL